MRSAKQNGQANSLVRFCILTLNNRDLNESVKKTTRCGASRRLRHEPRLAKMSAREEKKKASGFRLTKNGAVVEITLGNVNGKKNREHL